MLPIIATLAAHLLALQVAGMRLYSIPTSEEVRVASMAARDEGYYPETDGTFLDEMLAPGGKQPYPGYKTIDLYSSGDLIHSYSIRVQTGDIVDARTCQLFEYPDLIRFKQKLMNRFGTDPVSKETIATEVGCQKIDIVRVPQKIKR